MLRWSKGRFEYLNEIRLDRPYASWIFTVLHGDLKAMALGGSYLRNMCDARRAAVVM